ncbi:MAG: hypothetical protein HQ588_04710 [Deltaproteobacteria bacterium]|nr:hypothetical protein [Deltaproteobacteria bacterium]
MKNKAKRLLLIGFAVLVVVSLLGCAATDRPTSTNEQVISVIKVYGVPYINSYLPEDEQLGTYGHMNPVGDWAAAYEGDGQWRIQGAVVVKYKGEDLYGSTTWTYTEGTNKISLIWISCEPEAAPPIIQ